MPTNLGETLDQEHNVNAVLGLIGMAIDMADQENDWELYEPVSEPEDANNLAEQNR
jgi:hypothetical protein